MPEIISRKHALSIGLNKYFTGEPCKNNHLAERYVQSGTCEECIRAASHYPVASPECYSERILARQQRAEIDRMKIELRMERLKLDKDKLALSQTRAALRVAAKRDDLSPLPIMVHHEDVEYFKARMLALAMEIDPSIQMSDLLTNKAKISKGFEYDLHHFKTFKANHIDLMELKESLNAARRNTGADYAYFLEKHEGVLAAEAEDARRRAAEDEDNGRPSDITA